MSARYIIIAHPHYEEQIGIAGDRKIKFVAEPNAGHHNMIQFVNNATSVIGFQGKLTTRNELSAHLAAGFAQFLCRYAFRIVVLAALMFAIRSWPASLP